MERNILLTIAYDGSGFHGWQKQPGVRTVQGHLEQVMSRTFGREILLSGTSRTDAGVHALGQRATMKTDIGVPIEKLALVVNNALCAAEGSEGGRGGFAKSPVRIVKAEEMPEDFHARFSCKGKKYIYRIHYGSAGNESLVFERNYTYHVGGKLNADAMNESAAALAGTHDFKAFEASGSNPRETTVRTIFSAEVIETEGAGLAGCPVNHERRETKTAGEPIKDGRPENSGEKKSAEKSESAGESANHETGGSLEIHISGDGFLYNMVRIITGTLVEIGQGKRSPEDIKEIIESKDRTAAGHTAPPNGLYLAEVYY